MSWEGGPACLLMTERGLWQAHLVLKEKQHVAGAQLQGGV